MCIRDRYRSHTGLAITPRTERAKPKARRKPRESKSVPRSLAGYLIAYPEVSTGDPRRIRYSNTPTSEPRSVAGYDRAIGDILLNSSVTQVAPLAIRA
eukprot:1530233-Rhodomonas_salina.6